MGYSGDSAAWKESSSLIWIPSMRSARSSRPTPYRAPRPSAPVNHTIHGCPAMPWVTSIRNPSGFASGSSVPSRRGTFFDHEHGPSRVPMAITFPAGQVFWTASRIPECFSISSTRTVAAISSAAPRGVSRTTTMAVERSIVVSPAGPGVAVIAWRRASAGSERKRAVAGGSVLMAATLPGPDELQQASPPARQLPPADLLGPELLGPFLDGDEPVGGEVAVRVHAAVGPPDLDPVDLLRRSEPEVEARVVGRQIAARAAPLLELGHSAGGQGDPGADGVP